MIKFKGLSIVDYGEMRNKWITGYYIECNDKSYIITDVNDIYYDDEISCDVYEVDINTVQLINDANN